MGKSLGDKIVIVIAPRDSLRPVEFAVVIG
jgi:hypothetical protein